MKKFLFIFYLILIFILPTLVRAQNFYSIKEIESHQAPEDCWMVIDGQVYDLSNYLNDHDRWLDIRDWCGRDATQDYNNKAGLNRGHSLGASEMLADYLIGDLQIEETVIEENESVLLDEDQNLLSNQDSASSNRYNVYLPLLLTISLYFISQKILHKSTHDFLWNSILLLGLIPSVIFGFILALADQLPILNSINLGKMLYQHVQLSVIFGTACILHFIKRLKIYLSQAKFSFKKKIL